eukprot:4014534-Pleurochrysis_carterae.AAC.1
MNNWQYELLLRGVEIVISNARPRPRSARNTFVTSYLLVSDMPTEDHRPKLRWAFTQRRAGMPTAAPSIRV